MSLSLYIHIPFCYYKCDYCSFTVVPLSNLEKTQENRDDEWSTSKLMEHYLETLHRQIDEFAEALPDQSIRTIYFGGGTPSIIGADNIIKLIDHIAQVWNIEDLEELNIEINPDPVEEMLALVKKISQYYKKLPRIRFSIGLQSFDNEVLEDSKRQYNFQAIAQFLRALIPLKMSNMIFNFDFIAFGKFNQTRKGDRQLRDPVRMDFFEKFVHSGFADSFSLYTLELQSGSKRYYDQRKLHYSYENAGPGMKKYGSDDDVYEEFSILKEILLDANYQRYEISNYSKAGANSIHNRAYRALDERLGLGVGATSFLKTSNLQKLRTFSKQLEETRWENNTMPSLVGGHFSMVPDIKRFSTWQRIDEKTIDLLSEQDFLKEKLLTSIRTMEGVILDKEIYKESRPSYHLLENDEWWSSDSKPKDTLKIKSILVDNREEIVSNLEGQWYCFYDQGKLQLSDQGMDIIDTILTELIK